MLSFALTLGKKKKPPETFSTILSTLWDSGMDREAWSVAVHAVTGSDMPERLNWTEMTPYNEA